MFKISLIALSALTATVAGTTAFAADAAMNADNDAINTACASDSSTAGCGNEKVGTGLLKCLHAYKKAHKDFKFSDDCKKAMKQRHADKKSGK
jgi:hypothetical protein